MKTGLLILGLFFGGALVAVVYLKDQGMATYAEIEKILDIMPAAGPASCENTQTGRSTENCKPPH